MSDVVLHFLGELLRASQNTVPLGVIRELKVKRLKNSFAVGLVIPISASATVLVRLFKEYHGILPVECLEPFNCLIVVRRWRDSIW